MTWQKLIQKNGGTITNTLDLSALAKVSDGYSQGYMAQAVQSVLTERRLLQLPKKPLVANEFLQMLARSAPIYPEEEEMLKVPALPSHALVHHPRQYLPCRPCSSSPLWSTLWSEERTWPTKS